MDSFGEKCLSCIFAQGLPTSFHGVQVQSSFYTAFVNDHAAYMASEQINKNSRTITNENGLVNKWELAGIFQIQYNH